MKLFWGTVLFWALTAACSSSDKATDDGSGGATGSSTVSSTTTATAGPASSTGMSSSSAGGSGGTGGSPPMGWTEGPPTLNNDAACEQWMAVHPEKGEEGHLYAVRLTPPSYPFQVTDLHYEMVHDPDNAESPCDAQPKHRVEVFVSAEVIPPASPTITQIDMPAVSFNMPGVAVLVAPLPQPITLQTGEHLYVAVELVDVSSCVFACGGATVFDRDYWSNATAAPYSWATLDSFDIQAHARIGANGTAQ